MQEKELERKLKDRVERMVPGSLCLKFESPGFIGVPDRIILLPCGTAVFAELKAPGKKERKVQKVVQGWITSMGFMVFPSVDSVEKVQEVVDYCRAEVGCHARKV